MMSPLFKKYIEAPTKLYPQVKHVPAVKPVPQIMNVDIPAFMKRPVVPAPKPTVKQTGMTFAQILAESERILRDRK